MELRIDEEIKAILQPLSDEEKAQLEQNILDNGCRDPLVTWEGILIDGHNRHEICTRNGIEYRTIEIELADREAVIDWVERNQLGRRNLTPDWFRYLLGRLYGREKKAANDGGKGTPKTVDQNDPRLPNTAARIAKEHAVSEATVKRAAKFAEQVDADPALKQALVDRTPVAAVVKEAKKEKRKKEIERQREEIQQAVIEQPSGVFDVVVMDPPWNYGREYDPESSRVANPYPEMGQQELLSMAPPFADDCVLFLWTTHQFMWDAKELLDHWGFSYKATVVWDKQKMGMGSWLRMQCEFCLVGIKGKPFWENTSHRDIISEPRREHSRKPEAFYEMVEDITAGSRLDYFSRTKRDGWEVFGNDTTKF